MADVDELRIEVEASAGGASSNIRQLADDVQALSKSLNGLSGKLERAAGALGQLKNASYGLGQSADGIRQLGEALSTLRGERGQGLSSTYATNLTAIGQAVATIPPSTATSLQAVGQSLQALSQAQFSKTVATAVTELARGLSTFQIPGGQADRIAELAPALSQLAAVPRISSSVGHQLSAISEAMQSFAAAPDVDAGRVRSLVEALSGLADIPKNGLSNTVRYMMQLPQAAAALHNLNFAQLAEDCRRLSAAMADLPDRLANVAAGMRALSRANAAANRYDRGGGGGGGLLGMLRRLLGMAGVAMVLRRVAQAMRECVEAAGNYMEDMNLFAVAMGEYGQAAYDYAQRVEQALGINPQEWLRGQGVFMSMARGMGIASDNAALMSQQLTQLSYDLASFYNIDVETAMEKVQAGLSGQLRPLRELGYDLSDAALKEYALSQGIAKSTGDMTQAEKALLRYNMMISQVSFVHGDMARTVQTPMNQLRILASTVRQCAVAWGGVLLPALQAVLSALIPLAKALAAIGNLIASLTGGKQMMEGFLAELGSGGGMSDAVSGVEDLEDATGGAAGAAGDAADAYKELKRTVLGFDELNKLSADSDSSGGSGGGGGGGAGGGGGLGGMELATYDFLGDVDSLYGPMVEKVTKWFAELGQKVKDKFDELVRTAKDSATRIRDSFEGTDILGSLQDNIAAKLNLIMEFATDVMKVLTPLWEDLKVPRLIDLTIQLDTAIVETATSLLHVLSEEVQGLIEGLSPLTEWIGDKLAQALEFAGEQWRKWKEWLDGMAEPMREYGEELGKLITNVLQPLTPILDAVFEVIGDMADMLNSALRTAIEWLVEHATDWLRDINSWFDAHGDEIDAFMQGIADGIGDAWDKAKEFGGWLSDLWDRLKTAFTATTDFLSALGKDLLAMLRGDFSFSNVKQWLGDLADGAYEAKPKVEGLGTSMSGLGTDAALAEKHTKQTTDTISGTFANGSWINNASTNAKKAGKTILSGFHGGITDSDKRSAITNSAAYDASLVVGTSGMGKESYRTTATTRGRGILNSLILGVADNDRRKQLKTSSAYSASMVVGSDGFGKESYRKTASSRGRGILNSLILGVADKDRRKQLKTSSGYSASMAVGTDGFGKEAYRTTAKKRGQSLISNLISGVADKDRRKTLTGSSQYNAGLFTSAVGAKSYRDSAYGSGAKLSSSLGGGIYDYNAAQYVRDAASWIAGEANGYSRPDGYSNGTSLDYGLGDGIYDGKAYKYALWRAQQMAEDVKSTVNGVFRTGSPSREMRDTGKWVDMGLALGIGDYAKRPAAAAAEMANGALDAASRVLDSGALAMGMEVEAQASVTQQVSLDLDYDLLARAMAQGVMEGMVASGSNRANAQGSSQPPVMMVDGQAFGRLVLGSLQDMAASGYAPQLVGVV